MNQQPEPESVPPVGDHAAEAAPAPAATELPAEPAVERSRFSQWLASFGLGELENPLLTRARPPRRGT